MEKFVLNPLEPISVFKAKAALNANLALVQERRQEKGPLRTWVAETQAEINAQNSEANQKRWYEIRMDQVGITILGENVVPEFRLTFSYPLDLPKNVATRVYLFSDPDHKWTVFTLKSGGQTTNKSDWKILLEIPVADRQDWPFSLKTK